MPRPLRKRKGTPKALKAKDDRDMMAAIFGERIMRRVDEVVEPRWVGEQKEMEEQRGLHFGLSSIETRFVVPVGILCESC